MKDDIIVSRPDKEHGVVLTNKSDYNKVIDILEDKVSLLKLRETVRNS